MKIINEPAKDFWNQILKRPTKSFEDLEPLVKEIFDEIEQNGDTALRKYTQKFDRINLENIEVSQAEIDAAFLEVPDTLKEAIQMAKNNIEVFHKSQLIKPKIITTTLGVECWQESRGIEKVGIYIPGGTAPLFSTVLMLAIPAIIAGCKEIILCTPPDNKGKINPAILYAASITGVNRLFKVGGIQAIGALTYGTESIPKVYKIFGPGNQYVTIAKQLAQKRGIAIDMPAGPSELLVLADESAIPEFIASDLLSQAEHGNDSQVICISNRMEILDAIKQKVELQLEALPRQEISKQSLNNSKFICLKKPQDSIELINAYAPEHLILATKQNNFYTDRLVNAGSVFIGNYTPESAGDYASGTNHTLPTDGFAKNYSGVNLDSFCKKITFQKITKKGIENIGNTIETMAEAEGLQAHKNAVSIRLKSLKQEK